MQTKKATAGKAVQNKGLIRQIKEREKENKILLSLGKDITSCRNKNDFLNVVHDIFRKFFPFKELTISLINPDKKTHSAYLYNLTEDSKSHKDYAARAKQKYVIEDGVYDAVLLSKGKALVLDMDEWMKNPFRPPYITFFYENGIREAVVLPIRLNNESIGAVFIYMEKKGTFNNPELYIAEGICSQISIAVANIKAYEKIEDQLKEIKKYKAQLEEENLYLQEQIKSAHNYDEIVGGSPAIQRVFNLISNVAPSDSTVLIQGETGTGKELIARAIHNNSSRRDKLMVKVNCAAIPANLVESELFGHERGSFTGATERRIGKFELANNSTLFLDEVGEMALDLQVKLLRAIQEKEIERIGGKGVIKTDVRIIAATNRNLLKEVEAGRFRSDLFYRLDVFPIYLPALRERRDDIPLLVSHFIERLTRKSGKSIKQVSAKTIKEMMQYNWPGNIRELEHVVERGILMTMGTTLRDIYLPQTIKETPSAEIPLKTLEQNERDHIIAALKKSAGRIRGYQGAAELLNIPPTTLHSKIKKLKIKKTHE